jgi:hypothetical protein
VAFKLFCLSNIPLCGFLHIYGLLFKHGKPFFVVVSAPLSHRKIGFAQPPKHKQNE